MINCKKRALSLFSLGALTIVNAQQITDGKQLFETKCARCHGKDGTRGRFGAKNLETSVLTDAMAFRIISDGKSFMPSWRNKLTEAQIQKIIRYIKTLRK